MLSVLPLGKGKSPHQDQNYNEEFLLEWGKPDHIFTVTWGTKPETHVGQPRLRPWDQRDSHKLCGIRLLTYRWWCLSMNLFGKIERRTIYEQIFYCLLRNSNNATKFRGAADLLTRRRKAMCRNEMGNRKLQVATPTLSTILFATQSKKGNDNRYYHFLSNRIGAAMFATKASFFQSFLLHSLWLSCNINDRQNIWPLVTTALLLSCLVVFL